MRCVCWRSQAKVFQTKKNASVRARKDNFPKSYGLLPDGCIPADPPKDALWLREGRKEGRKEGQDGWSQKAPLFITICIVGRARGPDAGGFMEVGAVESDKKSIALLGQVWLPRSIFAEGKKGRDSPEGREVMQRHSKSPSLKSVSDTTTMKVFAL